MKKKFFNSLDLYKIAAVTNGKNEEAFDRAWDLWKVCCVTLRKKIMVDEEDYNLLYPYKIRLNEWDWDEYFKLYPLKQW